MERDRVAAIVRGGSAFVFVATVALSSCATEDEIRFGDPDRAAAGATAASSGTGLECTPDPDCDVSFANDVYPVLANKAKCGSSGCHLMATNGFQFPNAPVDAREALLAYTYQGSSPYVVPCDAAGSKLSCNLRLEDDAEGPFGTCGSQMPKALASDGVNDAPLTPEELALVTDWITCGAPAN
ncbi:MAG TPA: hypothetical protein VL400_16335 [Polyangiaceae bacterium]|jgi:hypothetical protein|nr:hypothetical protein [Polyangiaceae bacterium]